MELDDKIINKFPVSFRNKLKNKEIIFPKGTKFQYEKILVYRAVNRKNNDFRKPDLNDFKSYFQLGKNPKRVKGKKAENLLKEPTYYGVSSFTKREIVEQIMKFPNPNKKLAIGYVYDKGGPEYTKEYHVCWWLFEDVDLSDFYLEQEEA